MDKPRLSTHAMETEGTEYLDGNPIPQAIREEGARACLACIPFTGLYFIPVESRQT